CELLVKGRLSMSRLITVSRPETGAVRREHLITDHNVSVLIQTKFKFGVCNNDAAGQSVICALFIKSDGIVTKFCSVLFTFSREIFFQVGNALLIGNVFVVFTDLCFCGWCVDWLRQFVRFYQPFWKL